MRCKVDIESGDEVLSVGMGKFSMLEFDTAAWGGNCGTRGGLGWTRRSTPIPRQYGHASQPSHTDRPTVSPSPTPNGTPQSGNSARRGPPRPPPWSTTRRNAQERRRPTHSSIRRPSPPSPLFAIDRVTGISCGGRGSRASWRRCTAWGGRVGLFRSTF